MQLFRGLLKKKPLNKPLHLHIFKELLQTVTQTLLSKKGLDPSSMLTGLTNGMLFKIKLMNSIAKMLIQVGIFILINVPGVSYAH